MHYYSERSRNHHIAIRMRESAMNALKAASARHHLEEALDNLICILENESVMKVRVAWPVKHCYLICEVDIADFVFDEEMKSLLIEKLVQFHDPTVDQSVLILALRALYTYVKFKMLNELSLYMKGEEGKMGKFFTENDINLLIYLWVAACDEIVLWYLGTLLALLYQFKGYRRQMSPLFVDAYRVKSPKDSLRFLTVQMEQEELKGDYPYCAYFSTVSNIVPNLLQTFIKSATYLVNCWRVLYAADMFVEAEWIRQRLDDLTEILAQNALYSEPFPEQDHFDLYKAGIGRFCRVITFAIAQLPSMNYRKLHKFLSEFFARSSLTWDLEHFFVVLSKKEMIDVLHNRLIYKPRDCYKERELQFFLDCEHNLPALSREDLDIFVVPKNVNNALKLFSDSDLLSEPEVGCRTILQVNQYRIPQTDFTHQILDTLDRWQRLVCRFKPRRAARLMPRIDENNCTNIIL